MKNIITIAILLFFGLESVEAQNKYLKFSTGYILFGTGDIQGYSIKIEFAKNFVKNSKTRLFIGPELSFENGVQNPKIKNPSREEFMFGPSFYHITNTILSTKASYYPFHRIVSGFYLCGGVSFGYSTQSTESQADLVSLANGDQIRRSYLRFDNEIIYGYRVGSGYKFKLTEKFSTGFLVELHNYNNNDFNSFWGTSIAWHF